MALKKRDTIAIGTTGNYMQEASQNLKLVKNNIIKDIDNMLNNYQGKDADAIHQKFIEAVNKMDSLIERFDYYSQYMLGVSNYDKENISNANKEISTILNASYMDDTVSSIENININMNGGDSHAI